MRLSCCGRVRAGIARLAAQDVARPQTDAPAVGDARGGSGPTVSGVNDDEREALQWLTVEELAARRRRLVRDYDREIRGGHPEAQRIASIEADAEAIAAVQKQRREL